jgi:glyoxylase-like metal-dependent hydrolase (beta-lactamase superfamily II)
MALEVKRLHLASLRGVDGRDWPVHGFVISHPGGAALVDTGVGGPQEVLNDWRVVNRTAAGALSDLGMTPADISLVINTHLHFDHCGQNAVFRHAPIYVQRRELARAERESPELCQWFGFMNARFELLDGDAAYTPRQYTGPADQKLVAGQVSDVRPRAAHTTGHVRRPGHAGASPGSWRPGRGRRECPQCGHRPSRLPLPAGRSQ